MGAASTYWSTAIVIALLVALGYVVYKLRSAARANRERSEERAAAMLLELHTGSAAASGRATPLATAAREQTPTPLPAAPQDALVAAAPPTGLPRRQRIFTDAQRLLYLALRAAMPDYAIMAHIRIVDLLDLPQDAKLVEREARLVELARQRLDFVACNRDLVPVAAMVLYEPGITSVPDESVKIEALRELGIRFLRFRADSLPRPAELRSLILS